MKKRSIGRVVGGAVGFLALVYFLVGVPIYFGQDFMIFPAPDISSEQLTHYAKRDGVKELSLVASDQTPLYGRHGQAGGRRAVLFFHGNGASVGFGRRNNSFLTGHGWDLIAVEYRGYPGSGGTPSEEGMALDAMAAWRYATETVGIESSRLVLYGRSLGGGVASRLASKVEPAGLVLESTFTSLSDVAAQKYWYFPARLLVRHPFNTMKYAPNVHCPTLIVHGTADTLVPVSHGRALAKLFDNSTYIEAPGFQHNQEAILGYQPATEAFLDLLDSVDGSTARDGF